VPEANNRIFTVPCRRYKLAVAFMVRDQGTCIVTVGGATAGLLTVIQFLDLS